MLTWQWQNKILQTHVKIKECTSIKLMNDALDIKKKTFVQYFNFWREKSQYRNMRTQGKETVRMLLLLPTQKEHATWIYSK